MRHCPSHDWDRHLAQYEGPSLVGVEREARSPKAQVCAACYGPIAAGQPHMLQPVHDEDGRFTAPMRTHKAGDCPPYEDPEF